MKVKLFYYCCKIANLMTTNIRLRNLLSLHQSFVQERVSNGEPLAGLEGSFAAALEVSPEVIVDHFVIPNVHPTILPAISGGTTVDKVSAVGVLETYSVAATIEAADIAVKAASVVPIRMHLAFGIGGKSYVVFTGDVADVNASITAGAASASEKGLLVQQVVIPRPHKQVVDSLL